jgi:hypothetical protein
VSEVELVLVVGSHSRAAVVCMKDASVVFLEPCSYTSDMPEKDLRLLLISVAVLWWWLTTVILLSGKVRHGAEGVGSS